MILGDGALAVYIAAGLAALLLLLWCVTMFLCKGPCRSFSQPVKSLFDMHMDPATRNTALQNKYELYHYHLMTPRTPVDRHQLMVPTPLTQAGAQGAFDFGAVLRTQAMDRERAQGDQQRAKRPLIKRDGSDSSSESTKEVKKTNTITVNLQTDEREVETEDKPLSLQSSV